MADHRATSSAFGKQQSAQQNNNCLWHTTTLAQQPSLAACGATIAPRANNNLRIIPTIAVRQPTICAAEQQLPLRRSLLCPFLGDYIAEKMSLQHNINITSPYDDRNGILSCLRSAFALSLTQLPLRPLLCMALKEYRYLLF